MTVSCLLLFMITVAALVANVLFMKTHVINNPINEINNKQPINLLARKYSHAC